MAKSVNKQLWPREHGAWAMLLIPYCIGVAVAGGFSTRTILGLIGVLLLFLSRPPLIILLTGRPINGRFGLGGEGLWLTPLIHKGTSSVSKASSDKCKGSASKHIRMNYTGLRFGLPAASGLGVFAWLFMRYGLWPLLLIGLVGAILFILHTRMTLHRQERTIWGELLGILTLTITAPLAAYLSRGRLTGDAFALWLLNALYFAASVFYIKMRVRASTKGDGLSSKRNRFALAKNCLAYLTILALIVAILIFAEWVPALVILAFVPMMAHTAWSIGTLRPKLEIKKQGFMQVGLSLIYAALMIISYKL